MFDVGVPELVLVLVVALVVFGPGKLPEIGASIGKAIKDFRGATQAISNEVNAVTNFDLLAEDEATTKRILAEKEAAAKAQTESANAPHAAVEAAAMAYAETPVTTVEAPVTAADLRPVDSITEQIAELEESIKAQERLRLMMGDQSTNAIIATIRARIEELQRRSSDAVAAAAAANEPAATPA